MRRLLKGGVRAAALGLVSSLLLGGSALMGGALTTGCGSSCTEEMVIPPLNLKVTDATSGEELCDFSAHLTEEGAAGGVICTSCPCLHHLSHQPTRYTLVVSADGYEDSVHPIEVKVDECDHAYAVHLTVRLTPE